MRVAGPLPTLQLGSQAGNAWQRTLQPGQVLNAVVVSAATAGTAVLRIGPLELIARTELALARDQSLVLEVLRGGDRPELRVLHPEGEAALLARALRTSLPRQAPPGEQLARILDTARQLLADETTRALGREVAATLRDRVLTAGTEPATLRQALAQSGLFLEANLARGVFDPADLKVALLRLLARLQPPRGTAPGPADPLGRSGAGQLAGAGDRGATLVETLGHLIDDALAGIRWQQISSLPDEIGRGPLWHVGLPLRTPDGAPTTLWLRADRDPGGRDPEGERATLDISLSIAPLGPLHARLSLLGDRLSATIWAEDPGTADLVAAHLDLLAGGLDRARVPVAHLAARCGRPTAAADQPAPPRRGLLDETA